MKSKYTNAKELKKKRKKEILLIWRLCKYSTKQVFKITIISLSSDY